MAPGLDSERPIGDRRAGEQTGAEVAQVTQSGLAGRTSTARRYERQHDVVADFESLDALAQLDDDARAFMSTEYREASAANTAAARGRSGTDSTGVAALAVDPLAQSGSVRTHYPVDNRLYPGRRGRYEHGEKSSRQP